MILLFDAANTLIYKPTFYKAFLNVLKEHGYKINASKFQFIHKLLSETYDFPDRTTKEFYFKFNSELLYALGIIPTNNLLDNLFDDCSYLPWEKFEDTKSLETINYKKVIISNFHGDLTKIIENLFGSLFSKIIISEEESERKPSIKFFEIAIKALNVTPDKIIFVGDSIKLDIEPAKKLGIKAVLIDRKNNYEASDLIRITDMSYLKTLI